MKILELYQVFMHNLSKYFVIFLISIYYSQAESRHFGEQKVKQKN